MKHHESITNNAAPEVRVTIEPEWVLAAKYQELTGTTPNAVHQRRKEGVWLDGTHCAVIARRLYVNVKEADKWIRNQVSQRQQAY